MAYHSDFNFARTIGYEKAIGKMGAVFAVSHKRDRVTISKHVWRCFNVIQMNFCVDLLLNETWIHYFTPETKIQSK